MTIKEAAFIKHISLLAAGLPSDMLDAKPQYWEAHPTIIARTIAHTFPRGHQ